MSKPQAMMSLAFSRARRWASSTDRPLCEMDEARWVLHLGVATQWCNSEPKESRPPTLPHQGEWSLSHTTYFHKNFSSSVSWMTNGTCMGRGPGGDGAHLWSDS